MAAKMVVFGLYQDTKSVEYAVDNLKKAGFMNSEISFVAMNHDELTKFTHERPNKIPEGTIAGAGTGAIIGGTLGWLAGIGAISIPGIGPVLAAGPIVAALAGAGVGSAVGGVSGGVIGLGIPEYEIKRYANHIKEGGMLLTVHTEGLDRANKARKVLNETDAKEISSTFETEKEDPPTDIAI